MSRAALAWPLCALALWVWGCDDQPDPENIPFEGVDVNAAGDPRKSPVESTPTASASATAKPKPRVRYGSGTKKPTGSITGCCAALSAAVKTAKDQGARAMYGQAAAVCYRKSKEVEAGKLEAVQAKSQVRSSLLDEAPAACR